MNKLMALLLLGPLCLFLAGCGQYGPLYLPKNPPSKIKYTQATGK